MPQSKRYTAPFPLKIYKMKCKSTLARGIHSNLTPTPVAIITLLTIQHELPSVHQENRYYLEYCGLAKIGTTWRQIKIDCGLAKNRIWI